METLAASIVIKGSGFTPQAVSAETFSRVMDETPINVVISPILAVLQYPSGIQLIINEDRFEARRDHPPAETDTRLTRILAEALKLWPLVKPNAIGINFILGGTYGESKDMDALITALSPKEHIERILSSEIIGSIHSFTFMSEGARVTFKITTDAIVNERLGYLIDINAHYEPPFDVQSIMNEQEQWHSAVDLWARELIHEAAIDGEVRR